MTAPLSSLMPGAAVVTDSHYPDDGAPSRGPVVIAMIFSALSGAFMGGALTALGLSFLVH